MKTRPDPAKKTIYKDTCATAQDFCSQKKKKKQPKIALSPINWKLPCFSMRQ
jgi:hypothetical protein